MGWFSGIRRAVVKPFKQASKVVKKVRQQVVKAVPVVHKVGGFVRNPAKKVIPNSIRKKSWYKKFAAPVITYSVTAAATAGLGAALGGTAKAIKIAKGVSKGVTVASTFGKTRTTLRKIQGAKVQAQKVVIEQQQLAADSRQLTKTQQEIAALKANIEKAKIANTKKPTIKTADKKQQSITPNKPTFNTKGAVVGAGTGFFIAGPVGAAVGGAVGGLMKTKDLKGA